MATVEPLIPGTMTASPMKKPSRALLHHVFLLYFISAISRLSFPIFPPASVRTALLRPSGKFFRITLFIIAVCLSLVKRRKEESSLFAE